MTIRAVATKYQVHRASVSRILHASHISAHTCELNLDQTELDWVISLRRDGMNWRDVEAKVGKTRHALSRLLKMLGYGELTSRQSRLSDV